MKLYQSPTSPFVRMARATAELKGLASRIELMDARADQAAFEKLNPLNKVPTLVTDDGEVLIESRLICQYLDGLAGGPQLYPKDDGARRKILQQEALIHGVMDASVARRMDQRKPDAPASAWWEERQKRKVDIGLNVIEKALGDYTGNNTVTPVLVGCMCHFLDRVCPDDWRQGRPGLAKWYESYRKEPHMAKTEVNE
jgi:glutathione S-transferase